MLCNLKKNNNYRKFLYLLEYSHLKHDKIEVKKLGN